MILRTLLVTNSIAFVLHAANPFQPVISPNGVVNAASYLSPAAINYGIARGSMFTIFGSALGPVDLVQATSFPLPSSEGLAGTRVLLSIGAYNVACPVVYTSLTQVAAIMPSNAPEGDGSLVVSYQNLASTSVSIKVVRSALGIFTRNQGGSGPAIVQNFVTGNSTPLNSLTSAATPGQTVILWGTGLGPAGGDDGAGPLPGALPFLDALYVGGQRANVRYAGRSGCCAAIDQISFDVPAGVLGCYVPITAIAGGNISNVGTISVSASGLACDDPLTYRAATLNAAQQGNRLRTGRLELAAVNGGGVTLTGQFFAAPMDAVLSSAATAKAPLGTCSVAITRVGDTLSPPPGGLNAGSSLSVNAPLGQFTADSSGSGTYSGSKPGAVFATGNYGFAGQGGSDVGQWSTSANITAPAVWSNISTYTAPSLNLGVPLTFTWTGGDPNGLVTLRVSTANAIYDSVIECNAAVSSGSFTAPSFLTRYLYSSPATISFQYTAPAIAFTAPGLDMGSISVSLTTAVQTAFVTLPQ